MYTIASYHHKGGVGKTTTAYALAANAAADGRRTLLWDLDPQGAATRLAGLDRGRDGQVEQLFRSASLLDGAVATEQPLLRLFPADTSLRRLDRQLAGGVSRSFRDVVADVAEHIDVLVLDCPPSVSDVAAAVLDAADLVAVPLTAGPLAWSAFADLYTEIENMEVGHRPEVLAFLTMVDRRKALHRELVDVDGPPEGISTVTVPTDSRVERMAIEARPERAILTGRAGEAYRQLWLEVDGRRRAGMPASER